MNRDEGKEVERLGDPDLQTLKHDGVVLKPRFFSAEEILRIRETTLRLRPTAKAHPTPGRKWLMVSPFAALRQCVRSDIRNDLVHLSRVAQERGFREFSRRFYAQDVCLDHIMSIESPRCEDPITPWHTDGSSRTGTAHLTDQFTLKYFVYLNDIDMSSGAFSYLHGTNRLVTAIREGIVRGKIAPCGTKQVSDLMQALQTGEVVDCLLQQMSQQEIDGFVDAIQILSAEGVDPEVYSQSGAAGTLVVFDDRGIHRGGVPRLRERSMLRYNYVSIKYRRSAIGPVNYAAQMASKVFLPESIAAHW